MKITLTIILGFVALTLMSFFITNDEPRYKNLKVLPKDITKAQMDSVMHHFAGAMGQKCNFCHVFNQEEKKMDFVSDAKEEKETSRSMMKMMIKLNKKFFEVKNSKQMDAKLQVTCFTCHHGSPHPDKNPQQMGPPPRPGAGTQGAKSSTDSTKH